MSELNFIEKLLDGVGVEWVALGDVTLRSSNIKVEGCHRQLSIY